MHQLECQGNDLPERQSDASVKEAASGEELVIQQCHDDTSSLLSLL